MRPLGAQHCGQYAVVEGDLATRTMSMPSSLSYSGHGIFRITLTQLQLHSLPESAEGSAMVAINAIYLSGVHSSASLCPHREQHSSIWEIQSGVTIMTSCPTFSVLPLIEYTSSELAPQFTACMHAVNVCVLPALHLTTGFSSFSIPAPIHLGGKETLHNIVYAKL